MITPIINNSKAQRTFQAFKPMPVDEIIQTGSSKCLKDLYSNSMAIATNISHSAIEVVEAIKKAGIRDVATVDDNICLLTKKGHSFWIKPSVTLNRDAANIFVLNELNNYNSYFGIPAYIKTMDTLRRSDIVKKGLNLSSNKLDYMDTITKEDVVTKLSKKLHKHISIRDIFASSNGVYYPDLKNYTVYETRVTKNALKDNDIATCKFIPDANGNIIGYERRAYDIVRGNLVTTKYVEQQEPIETLPEIVDRSVPYRYANVCRFGNYKLTDRYQEGINLILSQLKQSGSNASIENLQGIKITKDGIHKDVLIGYYSPKSGRSLIFDKFGKFMYRIEYIKNENGDIIDVMELK